MIKVLAAVLKPTKDGWSAEIIAGDPDSTIRKTSRLDEFFVGNSIGPCSELDTPLKVSATGITATGEPADALMVACQWVQEMHSKLEEQNEDRNEGTGRQDHTT